MHYLLIRKQRHNLTSSPSVQVLGTVQSLLRLYLTSQTIEDPSSSMAFSLLPLLQWIRLALDVLFFLSGFVVSSALINFGLECNLTFLSNQWFQSHILREPWEVVEGTVEDTTTFYYQRSGAKELHAIVSYESMSDKLDRPTRLLNLTNTKKQDDGQQCSSFKVWKRFARCADLHKAKKERGLTSGFIQSIIILVSRKRRSSNPWKSVQMHLSSRLAQARCTVCSTIHLGLHSTGWG